MNNSTYLHSDIVKLNKMVMKITSPPINETVTNVMKASGENFT